MDLERILLRIAQHDVDAALRIVLDLEERMKLLLVAPQMGRPTKRQGVLELVLDDYVVPYRIGDDGVVVLRVWHGKQRWWG